MLVLVDLWLAQSDIFHTVLSLFFLLSWIEKERDNNIHYVFLKKILSNHFILLILKEATVSVPQKVQSFLIGTSPTNLYTAEVPVDAPADTKADILAEVSADAPVDAPADAPAEVSAEAPIDAPADSPADAPAEVSAEAPIDAPVNAPAENVNETRYDIVVINCKTILDKKKRWEGKFKIQSNRETSK